MRSTEYRITPWMANKRSEQTKDNITLSCFFMNFVIVYLILSFNYVLSQARWLVRSSCR